MTDTQVAERMPAPIDVARRKLEIMGDQFKRALPVHIPVDRFKRVIMTALQNNPKILECSEQSVWNAMMKAAQDGLLPDGRDGAIVPYKGEARWMPMIGGIRKMVRNSGEISTWEAHCVYQNDKFEFELGDEPFIKHAPALADRGQLIAAYSIAVLKDGSKSREVMSVDEIEGVRSKSSAKDGPWKDPVFYPEMVRKTVARRHAKVLPLSSDLDDLIRRDDDLYDFKNEHAPQTLPDRSAPKTLANKLDALAAPSTAPTDPTDSAGQPDDAAPSSGQHRPPQTAESTAPGPANQAEKPAAAPGADLLMNLTDLVADMKTKKTMAELDSWHQDRLVEASIEDLPDPERRLFDKAHDEVTSALTKAKKK